MIPSGQEPSGPRLSESRLPSRVPSLGLLLLATATALTSCGAFSGLTREERSLLSEYQGRAQLYYDGANYDSAMRMVEKGLALQEDDYKLHNLEGAIHFQLRFRDRSHLRRAERALDAVHEDRNLAEHHPSHLLFYGKVKQELGRDHKRQAEALQRESENGDLTPTEQTIRAARATEHAGKAIVYQDEAATAFKQLVENEELLRFAHKGLMELAVEREDYPGAVYHAELFLARNLSEQEAKQAIINDTGNAEYELSLRAQVSDLRAQELRVREALAEMHYRKRDYASSVDQLDRVLALDPSRSTQYYNRARALEKAGRVEEARRDYEKFLGTTQLPPSDERVGRAFQFKRGS